MRQNIFEEIAKHIYDNIEMIMSEERFDYPDYANLPTRLIDELTPEAVDAIQNILFYFGSKFDNYKSFFNSYEKELNRLGEKVI